MSAPPAKKNPIAIVRAYAVETQLIALLGVHRTGRHCVLGLPCWHEEIASFHFAANQRGLSAGVCGAISEYAMR
jgi:hypothetical protein